jgi:hypothetical protein
VVEFVVLVSSDPVACGSVHPVSSTSTQFVVVVERSTIPFNRNGLTVQALGRLETAWFPYDGNMGAKVKNESRRSGWSRPVALPADIDDPNRKAKSGTVTLPARVFWSGPDRTWDLDNRRQQIQVYEIILTEGTEEDVRDFIDLDTLLDLWPDLWLSPHVRSAWIDHLKALRGVTLEC